MSDIHSQENEQGIRVDVAATETPEQSIQRHSQRIQEDPAYLEIRQAVAQEALSIAGIQPNSPEAAQFLFSDPLALQLDARAVEVFRQTYPEKAKAYDEAERVRVYEKPQDDPAFRKMEEGLIETVNREVNSGRSVGWDVSWDRVYIANRDTYVSLFIQQYPEKAQGYADTWNQFVAEHPDVATMHPLELDTWLQEHPRGRELKGHKEIAEVLASIQRKKEIRRLQEDIHRKQMQMHEDRRNLAVVRDHIGISDSGEPTATERGVQQEEGTMEEKVLYHMMSVAREQIPEELRAASTEELQVKQRELANLPYMAGKDITPLLEAHGDEEGMLVVSTDSIVGSVSLAFANWSSEYQNRAGRVVSVAQELMRGTEDSVDHVFHVRQPEDGVKLKKIAGPKGDLFFVVDGTYRVAGSKLVQLRELPAQVESMKEVTEVKSTDRMVKYHWEKMIQRGCIKGKVEEVADGGQLQYILKVESQVVPWAVLPYQQFLKMNKVYAERYPYGFDDLKTFSGEKIPKEALTNEIALNYFLADRWDEYEKDMQEVAA